MASEAKARRVYNILIEASARDLEENEFWVIDHDDGPLWDTAAKRLDYPMILFCDAMACDWDEAVENGFRLAKLKRMAS